ncbi:MAG: dihydrolipoyl dehydrogenase family protein [Promethearchaeota archaeon]
MKEYDLVVVGSGVGLTVLSQGMLRGWKCALVENKKMGGTCLTRGCIPSKVLVYPADVIREAERAKKIGLQFKLEKLDWDLISKRVWHQIDESKRIEASLMRAPNLDVYKGVGEFTGEYTMKVKLNSTGEYSEEFKGKRFVLASGAREVVPPIPGLKETGFITSTSFFGDKFPKKLWKSLIIIGGGIIAAEFAHVFSAFGVDVTIVEMLPRLVSTEEPEISEILERTMKKYMKVLTSHKAIAVKSESGQKVVTVEGTNHEKKDLTAEEIFLAVGRRSNADILKVEKTGIETDKRGWIKTNQFLETNKPNIWAIGDANGKYQFRHKANHDAEILVKNMFGYSKEKEPVDYSAVPWAIFTHPQIGHVGMTEKQAIDSGHKIYIAKKRYSSVAKGYAMGFDETDEDDGLFKLVVDESYKILGAHIIGPHAAALIQPFVYLMNSGFSCSPPEKPEGEISKYVNACSPEAGSFIPIYKSMVIHPSINEVTGWAVGNLVPVNIGPHESHHH